MEIQPAADPDDADQFWQPSIHKTVATDGSGIQDLVAAIARHRAYLESSGDWALRERTRLQTEMENLLREILVTRWREQVSDEQYQAFLESVFTRQLGPIEAINKLLENKF